MAETKNLMKNYELSIRENGKIHKTIIKTTSARKAKEIFNQYYEGSGKIVNIDISYIFKHIYRLED